MQENEEMETKVPHYVELCMKLKEETGDDTNYFIEEWKDPEEEKKRDLMLFKERRRKAHENTKKFQRQQRKKKRRNPKPKPTEKQQFYSTNIEYRKVKSPVNATANRGASKLKLDFGSHSHIIQVDKNEKCDDLEDEIKRLREKLVQMEAKFLNFILRGNPTHKKQVDMELQWLFSQIRDGEDSKRDDELKKMKQENELLREENMQLSQRLVQNMDENEECINVNQHTLQRIAACYEHLCEHHGLNRLKTSGKNLFNMDNLVLKLEKVVDKIRNKKSGVPKKKKVNLMSKRKIIKKRSVKKRRIVKEGKKKQRSRKNIKRKSLVEDYQYPEPQQNVSTPAKLGKLAIIKKKAKKKEDKEKKQNKENENISNIGLKKQRDELNALNERVSKLDVALRESSAMLNDILVANV